MRPSGPSMRPGGPVNGKKGPPNLSLHSSAPSSSESIEPEQEFTIPITDGRRFLGSSASAITYRHHHNEDGDHEATETDLGKPLSDLDLPPIVFSEVNEDTGSEPVYHRPDSYIRFDSHHAHDDLIEDDYGKVIYEIDSDDEAWLKSHGTEFSEEALGQSESGRIRVEELEGDVSVANFEWCIQWLEKEAFVVNQEKEFLSARHAIQYDDTPCRVCREKESDDLNQIVICDGCDAAVHQKCYGCMILPEGAWLCDPCSMNLAPSKINCELCGFTDGIFKKIANWPSGTESNVNASSSSSSSPNSMAVDGPKINIARRKSDIPWAHVQCGLWLPHAHFKQKFCVGNIHASGSSRIPHSHASCYICTRVKGDTVKCARVKCPRVFHVPCGQKKALALVKNDEGEYIAWCDDHTPQKYAAWCQEQLKTASREKKARKRRRQLAASESLTARFGAPRARPENAGSEALRYWGGLVASTTVPRMAEAMRRHIARNVHHVGNSNFVQSQHPQALQAPNAQSATSSQQHSMQATSQPTYPQVQVHHHSHHRDRKIPNREILGAIFKHWTHKRVVGKGISLLKSFHPSNVVCNGTVLLNVTPVKDLERVYRTLLQVRNRLALLRSIVSSVVQRQHLQRLKLQAYVRLCENLVDPVRGAQYHLLQVAASDFDPNHHFLSSATHNHPFDWTTVLQNTRNGVYDSDRDELGGGSFFADLLKVVDPEMVPPHLRAEALSISDRLKQLQTGQVNALRRDRHPLSILLPTKRIEEILAGIRLMKQNPAYRDLL